jgi:hypothetical protein
MSRIRANTITDSAGTGTPSLTYGAQVGTGATISGSTNTITALTNGSERVRITSAGLVGINQSTPQTTFHSTGTTNGQQATFGIDDSGLKISTFQKTDNDAGVILDAQKSSNGTLTFATTGTERLRILSTGGLTFNGDTTSANALDDYEEGNWTPTLGSGGSSIGIDANDCKYVKVGKLVCCHFEIGAITSPTGSNMIMGGLPFAPNNEGGFPMSINNADFGTGYTYLSGHFQSSGSWGIFKSGRSQPWARITGSQYSNASWFGTIVYRVTS